MKSKEALSSIGRGVTILAATAFLNSGCDTPRSPQSPPSSASSSGEVLGARATPEARTAPPVVIDLTEPAKQSTPAPAKPSGPAPTQIPAKPPGPPPSYEGISPVPPQEVKKYPEGTRRIESPLGFTLNVPQDWMFDGQKYAMDTEYGKNGFRDNIAFKTQNYSGDFKFIEAQIKNAFIRDAQTINQTGYNLRGIFQRAEVNKAKGTLNESEIDIAGVKGTKFATKLNHGAMLIFAYPDFPDLYDNKVADKQLMDVWFTQIVFQKNGKVYGVQVAVGLGDEQKGFAKANNLINLIAASFRLTK